MSRRVDELARHIDYIHKYRWHCPVCSTGYTQDGGKKIDFINKLIKDLEVTKVNGTLICGVCVSRNDIKGKVNCIKK